MLAKKFHYFPIKGINMHIGGFHIFMGLFFLGVSTILVGCYLTIPFFAVTFFYKKKYPLLKDKYAIAVKWAFIASLILNVGYYSYCRFKYMGSDNAHYQAKEYYVAGGALSTFRILLTTFIHPENPILLPLNGLQKLIYVIGKHYLPQNDAEIAAWEDDWFFSCYTAFNHLPYGTDNSRPSPEMRKLLDRMWAAMNRMDTLPFADKEMERRCYLQNFVLLARYYSDNFGYYYDKAYESMRFLLKDKYYVERCCQFYQMLVRVKKRWVKQGIYEQVKKKTPLLEVVRQVESLRELERIIGGVIFTQEFSCKNPYLLEYINLRREFLDQSYPNHVLAQYREKSSSGADHAYLRAIGASIRAEFTKYILEEYCNEKVPGKRYFAGVKKIGRNPAGEASMIRDSVLFDFQEELKILEERHDD